MAKLLAESLTEYREINKLNETKAQGASGKVSKANQSKADDLKEKIKALKVKLKAVKKTGGSTSKHHERADAKVLQDRITKFEEKLAKLNESLFNDIFRECALSGMFGESYLNEGVFDKKTPEQKAKKIIRKAMSSTIKTDEVAAKLWALHKPEELIELAKNYLTHMNDQSSSKKPKLVYDKAKKKIVLGGVGVGKGVTGTNSL